MIFLSRRNRRLGDMVAGTLVVRDREVDSPHWGGSASRTFTAPTLIAASPMILAGSSGMGSDSWDRPPHLRVVLPATALAKLSGSDLDKCWKVSLGAASIWTSRLAAAQPSRIASALCT